MRADVVIPLLVYCFGIYAFGSILLYQFLDWRDPQRACAERTGSWHATIVGTTIWTVCLFWFSTLAAVTLLQLRPDLDRTPLQIAIFVLQLLFPPLIAHTFYAEAQPTDPRLQRARWGLGIALFYLVSLAVCAGSLFAFFEVIDIPRKTVGMLAALWSGIAFVIAAVLSLVLLRAAGRHRETPDERSSRRWMSGLFGVMILLVVVTIVGSIAGMPFMRVFRVIGTSMPLLFCYVAFYHEARFAFVDLFVKRAMALFATLVVLTLYIAVILPGVDDFELGAMRPLVLALLLLLPVSALPWLYRRIWDLVDSLWLGRRFTTVEAVKSFLSGLHGATDERQLVAQAERGLSSIFRAPVRIDLELRQAPPLEFKCVRDVPIHADGRRSGVILMGQRANQMPYFSEDLDLLDSLAEVFSYMLENIRLQHKKQEQEQLARELSLKASRSELKALRAQINPHFLFNALNAIAGLIHKDPFRADSTVEQLAEVFRYTLKGAEKEWALLEDEMDFVRAYLEVEQARFGDRLTVEVDVDPAVRPVHVPTMVVQTLVENAVKHGVASVRGPARIEVVAQARDDRLVVEVADNGPGFEESQSTAASKGTSYGLRNIRERFRGYFGERAELSATRDEARGLTVVRIAMPLEHAADGGDVGGENGSAGVA